MEKQKRQLFLGSLITLGIVYGDIGTSPLYVMKALLADLGESAKLDPWISYWLSLVSFLDSDADDNDQICFDRIESR